MTLKFNPQQAGGLSNLLLAVRKVNDRLPQARKIIAKQQAAAAAVQSGR